MHKGILAPSPDSWGGLGWGFNGEGVPESLAHQFVLAPRRTLFQRELLASFA
jgi:hypothetical protein